MKKIAILLASSAVALGNSAFADVDASLAAGAACPKNKKEAKEAPCPKTEFAWGIGLVGLAVIGVVAGVTAGMASGN